MSPIQSGGSTRLFAPEEEDNAQSTQHHAARLEAWTVMVPVVAGSSLAGVTMTRRILKRVPFWEGESKELKP
jgi:hypothetical protein